MVDLSISIVSWNVKEELRNCLYSIYDTANGISYEVIVVDNNSRDNTTQMIREDFPLVKLIENKENLGFAEANNQAIKEAEGKYILILNPDTIVLRNTLKYMLNFMDTCQEAGIASCIKIDRNNEPYLTDLMAKIYDPFHSFRLCKFTRKTFLDNLSRIFPNSRILKDALFKENISNFDFTLGNSGEPVEVNALWGPFLLVRRQVITQIAGFDERFFLEGEDLDLSYRARNNGWKIYFCPQCEIIHLGQRSLKQLNKKTIIDIRTYSHFLFYNKYKGKLWLMFRVFKMIGAKIIEKTIFFIFRLFFFMKKNKARIEDEYLYFDSVYLGLLSLNVKNLIRIIFNIKPKFVQNRNE